MQKGEKELKHEDEDYESYGELARRTRRGKLERNNLERKRECANQRGAAEGRKGQKSE